MKTIKNKLLLLTVLLCSCIALAQRQPMIYGIAVDQSYQPLEQAKIYYDDVDGRHETYSDRTGFYKLDLPVERKVVVWFAHKSFKGELFVELEHMQQGEAIEFNFSSETILKDVIIDRDTGRKELEGISIIPREVIENIPGLSQGVENIVKLMGGATGSNELSTQYSVRGGNYDENLVYVNDVEIYRPFLIRSGQQEGLSFTNTAMIRNVDFSAGGFQAKYGDKMSSVLDITYRRPTSYGAQLEASFLGGSLTFDAISKDKKWSAMVGGRYRNNSLLVNSQQTESNYKPTFADVQSVVNYRPGKKWEFNFIGNISQNTYNYQPFFRQTNFGTISEPIALQIVYDGQEKDEYRTFFGALTAEYILSEKSKLKFISSVYHTQEQEYFDILAQYALGDVDTNIGSDTFGDIQFARAVGSQLNHARNDLDGLINNFEVKGEHKIGKNNIQWGAKYTREDFRDRLVEWEVIDSAGFSIRPPVIDYIPNDQPYNAYSGPLVPYQSARATNFVTTNRYSGYAQWGRRFDVGKAVLFINAGTRIQQWKVDGAAEKGKSQVVVSPRAQLALKPYWDMDMLFRLSGGVYSQPPFYRELRDSTGTVQPNVKAQNSYHIVAGTDYSFTNSKQRKFKLVAEAYYKMMDNINTYTLENVRIRYRANNDATAYAYGADLRLNGELVPGTESWVTVGYMKTEENYRDKGYIARPTDQRLRFAVLFQDYVPNIPSLRVYLNMVYNTGLPGGSPSYADSYLYQSRLNAYRRADAGFSYVIIDRNDDKLTPKTANWLKGFKQLTLGLEIFNLFDNQNAITNTWVRDVYTKASYGIPNYLTSRVFSLKLSAKI
ncbi:TonB-dependent receptor plug domain-containing protein [Flavobacterium sp. RHBU_24]|uniref:TonB-dependent receptor plug domain-containing protein n=1 Tax=Flavobacterium sp. RHBU_24 TaxID=3391185 RepID=UPI0039854608